MRILAKIVGVNFQRPIPGIILKPDIEIPGLENRIYAYRVVDNNNIILFSKGRYFE